MIIHSLKDALNKIHEQQRAEKFKDDSLSMQNKLRSEIQKLAKAVGGRLDLKRVFQSFDADGNGTLDIDEFREGMLRMFPNLKADADMVDAMYRKFDEDGSGEIEYDEFAAFADATLDEEVEMTHASVIEPKVKIHTLNPKAIPSTQLYGNFNPNTQEWDNGVLAVIYRAARTGGSEVVITLTSIAPDTEYKKKMINSVKESLRSRGFTIIPPAQDSLRISWGKQQ